MQPAERARRRRRPVRLVLVLLALAAGGARLRAARRSVVPPAPPAPAPGRPRLVAVVGGEVRHGTDGLPEQRVLAQGRWIIGRGRDADLRLTDLTVSPRHGCVEVDRRGRVLVRDLGARNGLWVDGVPVAQAELRDGNRLTLGDVELVYRVDPVHADDGRQGGEFGEQPEAGRWQAD